MPFTFDIVINILHQYVIACLTNELDLSFDLDLHGACNSIFLAYKSNHQQIVIGVSKLFTMVFASKARSCLKFTTIIYIKQKVDLN